MEFYAWTRGLHRLYDKAVAAYRSGDRLADGYFSAAETEFLASVGLRPMHLYDFAEDFCGGGEPDWDTALLIMAARRDYFLHVQNGVPNPAEITADDLPARKAELGGIPWLPRIITKARGFLEGVHCPDIMYCCGGDRHFLKAHDIHPADFLRIVWAAQGDDEKILRYVRTERSP
jgi:hypothetical protein